MKLPLLSTAAILLVVTGTGAYAADSNAMSGQPAQSAAQDSLKLTRTQERTAWKDLNRRAYRQTAPTSFSPTIGATMPDDITLRAMPQRAANQLPTLRPYDFAVLQNKLLIVNPNDKKIVEVIGRNA
jgi:hypothetical protein